MLSKSQLAKSIRGWRTSCLSGVIVILLFLINGGVAVAQQNPYTYVKMSLTVPWALYFFFLACVLIPFVLIICLAWRRHFVERKEQHMDI